MVHARKVAVNTLNSALKRFDLRVVRHSGYQSLSRQRDRLVKVAEYYDLDHITVDFLASLPAEHVDQCIKLLGRSKAQLRQDLFVLSQLNFKRGGFFVEFGATNGINLSNSYLLENEFGWTGILAEPAILWHEELEKNRSNNPMIEKKCVWKDSTSVLTFNETEVAELSTITHFSQCDGHSERRQAVKTYDVETISLDDLLAKYDAPRKIDYLSIDTEGSEFEILSNFDFDKHSFEVITCEHNYTPMREKINELLTGNGYQRVMHEVSKWDDWYVQR